jgi:hypothetical protein
MKKLAILWLALLPMSRASKAADVRLTPLAVHLDFLRALPGVISADPSDKPGDIGRPINVVLRDLESLRAAKAAMAPRTEYWTRLVPDHAVMASLVGLPDSAPPEHAAVSFGRLLARMRDVQTVLAGAYSHGSRYFDVSFSRREEAESFRDFLQTHRIGVQADSQSSLKGLPAHPLNYDVEEGEKAAHLERLENSYADRLKSIPGVLAVEREIRRSEFGYAPIIIFRPVFASHESMGRALDAGLIPESFPVIEEFPWQVEYYGVKPLVKSRSAPRSAPR